MIKQFVTALILITVLAGCATGSATPTPTLPAPELTATAQQAAVAAPALPATATPIPPPSPTPTVTPWADALAGAANSQATPAPQLSPTAAAASTESNASNGEVVAQAEVLAYALNVRQGPGEDFLVLGRARAGEVLPVFGRDSSGNWLQVEFRDETGWVSSLPQFVRLLNGGNSLPAVATESTPVTTGAAAAQPAASKVTGGRLVFATRSGGDLYEVNVDGSGLRLLAGGVIDPAVSPDGAQVAFTRWDGAEFGALYLLNLDSGQERVVANDIRQPKSPTWSPDGQRIVISFQQGGRRDPQPACRTFDHDDGIQLPGNIRITSTNVRGDGTVRICYIPNEDLRWHLRRINVTSGQFEDLESGEYAYSPAWDPQNPWRVVYSGDRGLMQYDVNRDTQQPLTTDLRDTEAVFSPDGRQLAVTYKQHDHWEVYTLNAASGERQRLTKPPILADPQYNSAAPAWSPDGAQLAFVTDRAGPWQIWVMAADGSNPRPLLPPEIQAQLTMQYNGVNERLLNWID